MRLRSGIIGVVDGVAVASGLVAIDGIDGDELARALVDNISEMLAVVDDAGMCVAVNVSLARELRCEPGDLIDRPALDQIAPADQERALMMLAVTQSYGAPRGTGSFNLVRADGSVVPTHVTGCGLELGGRRYFAVVARPEYMQGGVETLLDRLLAGDDLADVLLPIVEFFAWRENRSRIAISWWDGTRLRSTGTGLPGELAGEDDDADGPWAVARRTGKPVETDRRRLPVRSRALAEAEGLLRAWVQPVAADRLAVPATVTVWTTLPELPPTAHAAGMEAAVRYVEMVLRWTDQVARLESAAHRDPLTGLANRRAFFDSLEVTEQGGAVLYCDLDGFKAVNDRFGHATGDALLVEVGRRLLAEAREGDLVARLGGDEYGVLLWDSEPADAERVAERVRSSCRAPFEILGRVVEIGISVGVAHDPRRLTEETVEHADRALYAEKRHTRPALRA